MLRLRMAPNNSALSDAHAEGERARGGVAVEGALRSQAQLRAPGTSEDSLRDGALRAGRRGLRGSTRLCCLFPWGVAWTCFDQHAQVTQRVERLCRRTEGSTRSRLLNLDASD